MALKLEKTTNFGVSGDYWVIDYFAYHKTTNRSEIILRLYANQEARDLAKSKGSSIQPLDSRHFNFENTQFHPEIHPLVEAYFLIRKHGYVAEKPQVGMPGDKDYKPATPAIYGEFYDAEDILDPGQVAFPYENYISQLGGGQE